MIIQVNVLKDQNIRKIFCLVVPQDAPIPRSTITRPEQEKPNA
jgi:hypothetical protein